MIDYNDGYFNFGTLFRIYGSASCKAIVFASTSNVIYLLLYYNGGGLDGPYGLVADGLKQYSLLDHPYPIAVIVTAFMFVLSAKVNFSYNRFWEACTAVHNMHAKWMEVGSTLAAFHMQSKAFDDVRPPSFGDRQDDVKPTKPVHQKSDSIFRTTANDLALPRGGERGDEEMTKLTTVNLMEVPTFISEDGESNHSGGNHNGPSNTTGRFLKSNRAAKATSARASPPPREGGLPFPDYKSQPFRNRSLNVLGSAPNSTTPTSRCSSGGICDDKNDAPPVTPFLREAAHLVSLLSAVALSTLRSDGETSIVEFVPGHRWPSYDSHDDGDMQKYGYHTSGFQATMKYLFDVSRTKDERSAYNAARPFPVIGGVSEREARMLHSARGAAAKTSLVYMWMNEFIIREQIHGSLGNVAPPIVSRIPQYLSDGHMWYNAARKMSYIPFPFPHAQMATQFVLISVVLMPTLMLSKAEVWFGFVLNFLTVSLFAGLNELSKELEYPFRGMPNDLPLNLFQAQYNEAIVTTFAGFHPDAHWEVGGEA